MRTTWKLVVLALAVGWLGACAASAVQPVSFMIFGDPAELKAYQTLVDAFQQKHPEIPIELIHIPDQANYRQRLSADLAAGTPANVVLINYRRYAGFAQKGVLQPLQPFLDQSQLITAGDFYAEALQPYIWRQELMCIPQNLSSLVVYYNKNLFDAAGIPYPQADWAWDDFLSTAQGLTKAENDKYGVGVEPSLIRVAPFIWQNGGELTANPIASRLLVDSPQARAAIQWFIDLQVKHHVTPDAVAAESEDLESRFSNGRLGMYLDSRRVVPTLRSISVFDWDVAPLPRGQLPATVLHSDAYCMTSATKDKDAAWKFIEFANSVEGQKIIAATGRTVPSLKSVAESDDFLDPNAKPHNSRVFLEVIPALRALPVLKNWVDIEETADAELERAFYGTAAVDDVIKAMVERTMIFFSETD
jgi:multiple sugar transport system substrate-binding protein